jgi:hypothetical protein
MLQYINSAYMNTDVLAGEKDTVLADSSCSHSKSDLCASWPEQVCTIFATKRKHKTKDQIAIVAINLVDKLLYRCNSLASSLANKDFTI